MTAATLAPGTAAPTRTVGPISRSDIVRYAGASGDFNPIHHDDDFARAAGFSSVFSMGMLPASLLAAYVSDWLGPANLRHVSVRFREQVWPGDTLTLAAVVTDVDRTIAPPMVTLELRCTRQDGLLAIAGQADFVVPS